MKTYSVAAFVLLSLIAATFGFCAFSPHHTDQAAKDTIIHYITTPFMPEKMEFAGEQVPLHHIDVRESMERELIVNMNFHSSTVQYLKKITRFFPVIEPILAENGIPDDFKYLSLIESDFMNKVSPKGATGFWQFMKGAALDYGLEVNSEVDERYHLEKATVAACKYLNDAYKIFDSWTMAAASYNMGKAGLSRQVKRQQSDYYYDLLLNDETMRYVYRIIAVKTILNDPLKYGFKVLNSEKYGSIPYTEVEVKTSIPDWADFAFKYQTNYKILKLLNPWLRDNKLTNASRKKYMIKIPAEGFRGDLQHRIDEEEAESIEKESEKVHKRDVQN
ncbi:MAG: lytic transglycosylase domain-containing protein [Bacteroidales bacterium]|jgi:hypothetical protein|nr:lytic transglycosylase domain-containing protein [Bacteroidales bacterium]